MHSTMLQVVGIFVSLFLLIWRSHIKSFCGLIWGMVSGPWH